MPGASEGLAWDEECGALGAAQLQTAVSIVQPGLAYLGHALRGLLTQPGFGDCHGEKGSSVPRGSPGLTRGYTDLQHQQSSAAWA